MDDIYVTLDGGSNTFREVKRYFDNPEIANELRRGIIVTFNENWVGLMGNILIKEFELIQD